MNGLDKLNMEMEQLDPIHAQRTGLKPPGAMRDQIQIGADFDASIAEVCDGKLKLAMFTRP